jgi:hypothetical protein
VDLRFERQGLGRARLFQITFRIEEPVVNHRILLKALLFLFALSPVCGAIDFKPVGEFRSQDNSTSGFVATATDGLTLIAFPATDKSTVKIVLQKEEVWKLLDLIDKALTDPPPPVRKAVVVGAIKTHTGIVAIVHQQSYALTFSFHGGPMKDIVCNPVGLDRLKTLLNTAAPRTGMH